MSKLLAGIALACVLAGRASAALVHVVFSGTVSDIPPDYNIPPVTPLDPSVHVGTRFTGSFVYDDASPLIEFYPEIVGHEGPQPETSVYDVAATGTAVLQIGTYSVTNDPNAYFQVEIDDSELYLPGISVVSAGWQGSGAGTPYSFVGAYLTLSSYSSPDGGPLHGTALPGVPWNLTDLPVTSADFYFVDSRALAIDVRGVLDYVAAVPEPESLPLWLFGALPLVQGFRRARS